MLLGGDEMGRTQRGNNNAYCQDNELSWFHWPPTETGRRLIEFTRRLIRLKHANPVFHRRMFFQGRRIQGSAVKDLAWFRPDGQEMTDEEWQNSFSRCLGLRLAGDAIEEVDDLGRAHRRRHLPDPAQRAPRAGAVRAARPREPRELGAGRDIERGDLIAKRRMIESNLRLVVSIAKQ